MEDYKFVGVVNLFDLYPAFLFPIYEKESKLYFHNGEKNRISSFEPITESVKPKIIYLSETKTIIVNKAKISGYLLGGEPVYGFQKNVREIFCANLVNMMEYIFSIEADDDILKRQIIEFVRENTPEYLAKIKNRSRLKGKLPILYGDVERELEIFEKQIHEEEQMLNDWKEQLWISVEDFDNDSFPLVIKNLGDSFKSNLRADLLKRLQNYSLVKVHEDKHGRLRIILRERELAKLKKEFDSIIKITSYNSVLYDIGIKCQNAIIMNDEQELIRILRSNYSLFYGLLKSDMVGKDLLEYLQKNVFEYFNENVPNNQ